MQRLRLLAGRELWAFLTSPATYCIVAIAWFAMGALFYFSVLPRSGGDLNFMFEAIAWPAANLQILIIPLLTMKLVSEERRSGTFEMLVTAPVRDHEVVLGKFVAAVAVAGALWLVLPAYAVVLDLAGGNPDYGPVLGTWIGVMGVGVVFTALGLVASAATPHQLLAGFLAVMLNVAALYLPFVAEKLPESWATARQVLLTGNLLGHTNDAAKGILDLVSLTYQGAFAALFLLFAVRVLEVRKWK